MQALGKLLFFHLTMCIVLLTTAQLKPEDYCMAYQMNDINMLLAARAITIARVILHAVDAASGGFVNQNCLCSE